MVEIVHSNTALFVLNLCFATNLIGLQTHPSLHIGENEAIRATALPLVSGTTLRRGTVEGQG